MEEIQKTAEEIAKDRANEFIRKFKGISKMLEIRHTDAFDEFWDRPKEEIQAVLDVLGVKAVNLFLSSKQSQQLLATTNADYEPLVPPYEYTINEDGTITLGDKIEVETDNPVI